MKANLQRLVSLANQQRHKLVGVALIAPIAFAHAVDTDPFTTAMTDATTKVGTYAAALVGLAAVAVTFMIAMKYVKKIVKAA